MQALSSAYVLGLASLVQSETGVPARLLEALAFNESSLIPNRTGDAGEVGLVQIKPATAAEVGFAGSRAQLFDPLTNLRMGARYLARMRAQFGSWGSALSAYNAGPGNVSRGYRGNLQSYARPILERAGIMAAAASSAAGGGALRALGVLVFAVIAVAALTGRVRR